MEAGVLWPSPSEEGPQVLEMQSKLHQWAKVDPRRRESGEYGAKPHRQPPSSRRWSA